MKKFYLINKKLFYTNIFKKLILIDPQIHPTNWMTIIQHQSLKLISKFNIVLYIFYMITRRWCQSDFKYYQPHLHFYVLFMLLFQTHSSNNSSPLIGEQVFPSLHSFVNTVFYRKKIFNHFNKKKLFSHFYLIKY